MFTSVNSRAASAYKRVSADTGVSTANPHQLVVMLFDGLMQSLNAAHGAMERGEIEAKGSAIGKAVRILEEGLRGGLNLAQGGALAKDLNGLYGYAVQRLTLANLRNDRALVTEVIGLIEPVADSWKQIRGAAAVTPAMGPGA
ncbi:MAG: flagellar export chaperone FliS [Pseudomonadota bacterium]